MSATLTLAFKVKPANISDEELEKRIKSDPPDEVKVSFWQLPLWIKIQYITTVLAGVLAIWKLLPFVIARIKTVLVSKKRQKILEIVMENPGISLKNLQDTMNEDRSTLRYHVRLIEEEGWIYSLKAGNRRLLFPAWQKPINTTALKSERKREILEILKKNGGMTARELADELGMNLKSVYHHLGDLKKAGLVKVDGVKKWRAIQAER